MNELNTLINDAAQLKAKIDDLRAELKEMQDRIAEQATFPPGRQTATIDAGGVTCKISRRETLVWDQDRLNTARAVMGDGEFLSLFGYEWKPLGKKQIDGFLAYAPPEKKRAVMDALTIKSAISVTFSEKEAA